MYDEIDSIDEAAKIYSNHVFQNRIVRGPMARQLPGQHHDITPEQEFWGHCSNIQAWVENNYDTRILMSNISFPLLRELARAGDPLATKVFKEEIALRLETGYPSVVQYLLNQGYIRYFTPEEFKTIIETNEFLEGLSQNSNMLSLFLIKCSTRFPTIFEDLLLNVLKLTDGKKVIDLSINISGKRLGFLIGNRLGTNPRYLVSLKNTLENLITKVDEKTRNVIQDCINETKKKIDQQKTRLPLHPSAREKKFEKLMKFVFDENVIQHLDEPEKVLIFKNILNDLHAVENRCAYCGKLIPEGKDVCEWCGHKRGGGGGFFPFPYIRKPPGGGGGRFKEGAIAVPVKV
jgi:hypothetical protein